MVASKLELADLLQAITDATVEVSGGGMWRVFSKGTTAREFYLSNGCGPLGIAFQNCSLVNVDELIASGTDQQIVRVDDLAADNRPFQSIPYLPIRSFLVLSVRNSTVKLLVRSSLPIAHPPFLQSEPKGSWPSWPCRFQSDLKMRNFTGARGRPARPRTNSWRS